MLRATKSDAEFVALFVSGGCIGALLTYLLWRFDSVRISFGDVAPAAIAFSVLLLILETVNGIDHGVYLLIKSRKADRLSQISLTLRDDEADGLDGRSGLIDLADIGRIAAHFSRELSSGLLQAKFRFFEGSSSQALDPRNLSKCRSLCR